MLAGKDFELEPSGLLKFADHVVHPEPEIRLLEDARNVFMKKTAEPGDKPLYYMYRGVHYEGDAQLFADNGIRHDLTVILPGKIDREYNKTIGHFHPAKPNSSETYPEYYEVLHGEALYVLQKNSRSGEVEEIMAVEAKKGDKVFIPSGYGHVTINPGEMPLVMANLIESTFKSLYEPFAAKKGAAYYYVETDNGRGDFVKNQNYHNSVGLKIMAAPNLPQPVNLNKEKTLYENFILEPQLFDILK
ncbi:glucose-6-phosphate isomerase family protein [Zhaonella formicivorans]|uniref:glucose-6-phosphate isomerase family protein n=1 Tax=Zhaonella formicivorans TaxID=2528593 RepID=UPI0010F2EAF7|nr:glucose-6-phosphate isomerase family protein [Zhaonella formicivorans]